MRNFFTDFEKKYIPNVAFKKNTIGNNYVQYCDYTDIQGYLSEQIELNPKLLAWLFDDNSLIGKSPLSLDPGRFEAYQDFYNSFDIYD